MKHTTNFFTFLVLFIASVMFLTLPVSAVVYEDLVVDPLGLSIYSNDDLLVSEGTSLSELIFFTHVGTGSTATKITSIPNYLEDAAVGNDGNIFFVLTTGEVYQFTGGVGLFDFVTDYNTSFVNLGDMDALSRDRSLVIDDNNDVYVSSDLVIYVFSYPSYSSSIYHTLTSLPYGGDQQFIESLGNSENGLLVGVSEETTTTGIAGRVILLNGSESVLYEGNMGVANQEYIHGVYSTDEGDIYFISSDNIDGSYIKRLNSSANYEASNIASVTYNHLTDLVIDDTGIIYVSNQNSDTIETYSTIGAQGGYSYSYSEGATGSKQLEYDTSTINSVYASYHNNSNVVLSYAIEVDISASGLVMEFETIDEDYYFVVDILNPDGYLEKQSFITDLKKVGWLYISSTAETHGALTYTSDAWENGTWTAHLYEYNTNTGLRALLDSCEYEITNTISITDIIETTPGVDPNLDPIRRIDALLESNAFVGLLIILACMGAFGKIGGVAGVVLGTVAGVSLSFLLGYIPAWVLFLMVLALCVVFVSKLTSGFGGNSS